MHKSPLLCLPLQDPVEHAHHSLFLHAYVDQVEISNGGRLVAIYAHCYEREQDILNPIHYLPLLRERPGALDHAKPLKTWSHPIILDQYLVELRAQLPHRAATLEFVKVLELCSHHSLAEVAQGVEQALETRSLGADTVAYFLSTSRRGVETETTAVLTAAPYCPPLQDRDLHQYDRLLRRWE